MMQIVIFRIKHKVKTSFKVMRGGGNELISGGLRNLYLFSYISETNLGLCIIFQRNLGPSRTLAMSGIVLFVTLVNGFQTWANVRKISILHFVGVQDTSLYLVYKFL